MGAFLFADNNMLIKLNRILFASLLALNTLMILLPTLSKASRMQRPSQRKRVSRGTQARRVILKRVRLCLARHERMWDAEGRILCSYI